MAWGIARNGRWLQEYHINPFGGGVGGGEGLSVTESWSAPVAPLRDVARFWDKKMADDLARAFDGARVFEIKAFIQMTANDSSCGLCGFKEVPK